MLIHYKKKFVVVLIYDFFGFCMLIAQLMCVVIMKIE
jgi:hypothetical protein